MMHENTSIGPVGFMGFGEIHAVSQTRELQLFLCGVMTDKVFRNIRWVFRIQLFRMEGKPQSDSAVFSWWVNSDGLIALVVPCKRCGCEERNSPVGEYYPLRIL